MTATRRWTGSLRFRLLAATLVALSLALMLAGVLLGGLFREHVMRQFEGELTRQLDQLTARLDVDAAGQPLIDTSQLSDPRWQKPFSGLYWQIDRVADDGQMRQGVLRSRSLWDFTLALEADALADGAVHVHEGQGPENATLMLLERTVRVAEQPDAQWRLTVAADLRDALQAVDRFRSVLYASLAVLLVLLALVALAQVAVGLSPLRKMQRALADVREARCQRLQGQFPQEVQPLIDDFNDVLDRNTDVVARARTHAGNLAHALKTPLSVMAQAATRARAGDSELGALVQEQVDLARQHIDWHLAHARVAASQRLPGLRTPLAPAVDGLLRVMARVHAERNLALACEDIPTDWAFAGESQDLQEMLGNVLENACLWARTTVQLGAALSGHQLRITLDDDGPGIAPEQRERVLARGVRLDESTTGSGLGLAIVADLASLYGGELALAASPMGGLRVQLSLPAAP